MDIIQIKTRWKYRKIMQRKLYQKCLWVFMLQTMKGTWNFEGIRLYHQSVNDIERRVIIVWCMVWIRNGWREKKIERHLITTFAHYVENKQQLKKFSWWFDWGEEFEIEKVLKIYDRNVYHRKVVIRSVEFMTCTCFSAENLLPLMAFRYSKVSWFVDKFGIMKHKLCWLFFFFVLWFYSTLFSPLDQHHIEIILNQCLYVMLVNCYNHYWHNQVMHQII